MKEVYQFLFHFNQSGHWRTHSWLQWMEVSKKNKNKFKWRSLSITLYGKQHGFIELSRVQIIQSDPHLIFFWFLKRLYCETNIFVFPWVKATITLERYDDFWRLVYFGLPCFVSPIITKVGIDWQKSWKCAKGVYLTEE